MLSKLASRSVQEISCQELVVCDLTLCIFISQRGYSGHEGIYFGPEVIGFCP